MIRVRVEDLVDLLYLLYLPYLRRAHPDADAPVLHTSVTGSSFIANLVTDAMPVCFSPMRPNLQLQDTARRGCRS